MLDRTTWSPSRISLAGRPLSKPRPRQLNNDRRAHITNVVVKILESAEPTRFAFEAVCRHAIRSRLCLLGWTWANADLTAARIVRAALIRTGARWPTWKEGQPEFTQDGHSPIERTLCIQCSKPLPEGHTKFCGQICAWRHHHRLAHLRSLEDGAAYDAVVKRVSFWQCAG